MKETTRELTERDAIEYFLEQCQLHLHLLHYLYLKRREILQSECLKMECIYTFIVIISYWTRLVSGLYGDRYRRNKKIFSFFSLLVILCLKCFRDQFGLLLLPRFRRGH